MIVGIESVPQLQPAACSFSGHGSNSCDKFIRVVAPDNYYDTILISDHFFKQMADEMGYVKLQHGNVLLQNLQVHINELVTAVPQLLDELSSIRERFDNLQTMEAHLTSIRTAVDNVISASKSVAKQVGSKDSTGVSNLASSSVA